LAINKRKILESAQKNLQKGLIDKALADYRTLLKADPRDSNVLLKMGDLYLKQGKREESINSYLRVAQQFTKDGFDAKAVALYKQISRLDPKRHDVCVPLAELYSRMGLIGDAISSLQTAADAAYRAGDKDDALELLRRMAALDPSNTPNRLKVAELLAQEGRRDEALVEYEAVAEELERRGEEEERIRVVERILAVDPERAPALREVARAKLAMSQFGAAKKLAEQLIGSHADDVEGYELLGHALLGAGEEEHAREVFRDLAERFRLRGDEDRARDLMQRFGGLQSFSAEETEAPLDGGKGVLELDSAIGSPDDQFLLDDEPLGDLSLGEARLGEPLEDPSLGETRLGEPLEDGSLGEGSLGAGSLGEEPDPLAPESPQSTPIGKIEPVQVLARKPVATPEPALDETPAPEATTDPEQLLAEATVYLRYGKLERAVGALRAVLAADPGHRAALEQLAEALAEQGDTTNAATAWQRAAEAALGAGETEEFERLRARLAELDADAAAALARTTAEPMPEPTAEPMRQPTAESMTDEVEVDLDFDLDATPDVASGSEDEAETGEAPALAAEDMPDIEFSDDFDGFDETPVDETTTGEPTAPETSDEDVVGEPDVEVLPADLGSDVVAPALDEEVVVSAPEAAPASEPVEEDPTATTPAQLSEQLEEAEFYLEQGLLDEARDLYEQILASAPSHPQAMLRLGEIAERAGEDASPEAEAAVAAAAAVEVSPEIEPAPVDGAAEEIPGLEWSDDFGPGAPEAAVSEEPPAPALEAQPEEPPAPALEAQPEEPPAPALEAQPEASPAPAPEPQPEPVLESATEPDVETGENTGDFDLAAELAFGIEGDESAVGTLAGTEEEGFEQVFSAFKSGVDRELGDADNEARYDLGIAYKEMGLLEDAIAEFRLAMQVETRRLSCLHMMGICALDLGRGADAVAHLEQALSLPDLPDDQCVALRYDLGRAYAAHGDVERARAAFEEVRSADPEFGDVERELEALEARSGATPSTDDAEDGEAYESFDELLAERPAEPATPRYESFDDLFAEGDEDGEAESEPDPAPEAEAGPEAEPEPVTSEAAEETEPAPEIIETEMPEVVEPESSDAFAAVEAEPADRAEPESAQDAEPELAPSAEAEPAPEPEEEPTPDPGPKRKRRKISFV
jgi:tetratricopeptide (TPR) repeat protein